MREICHDSECYNICQKALPHIPINMPFHSAMHKILKYLCGGRWDGVGLEYDRCGWEFGRLTETVVGVTEYVVGVTESEVYVWECGRCGRVTGSMW